jgi:hypothetical protein
VEPVAGERAAAAIAEEARAAVRSLDLERVICPLSGGWDSRLLAALTTAESGAPTEAWTVEPSSGDANEMDIAGAVAERLGIAHRAIEPKPGRYWRHLERSFELTEYQCQAHGWLVPFVDSVNHEPGTIVDGLGGDIWIKGLFLNEEIVRADGRAAITMLWDRLAKDAAAERLLEDPVLSALSSAARAGFESAAEPFLEHPAAPSLTAFRTRTAGGIAHSPNSMFATARPVATPLVAEGVIAAAIALPPSEKLGGAAYRLVLERAAPTVAGIRSSNDSGYRKDNERRAHYNLPRVRSGYVEALDGNPLAPWFSDRLSSALASGRIARVSGRAKAARLLAGIAMLGSWERRYRDRLRPLDPGDILG